ncbi:MAG: hypothetical protein K2J12_05935 [Muribaculaceae bacterium]|nr:hypothetical protein [Muribaculaceae bacterium]
MFTACTTSKTVVSTNVDLSHYAYASIINNETYHIPAELMQYEIQLYDAVEASALQLISDRRISELTPAQQNKLLLVKYGVNQNEDEAVVTVNFIDFMTGRPIVSCRGAFALGIDNGGNLRGAIKRVAKQIAETFKK